jgi:hypothetical protein
MIEATSLETLDPQERYTSLTTTGYAPLKNGQIAQYIGAFQKAAEARWGKPFIELAPVVDLLALTGRHEPVLPVHYPKSPDPKSKGQFEWFVGNKREGDRGPKLELGLANLDEGLPLVRKDGTVLWVAKD